MIEILMAMVSRYNTPLFPLNAISEVFAHPLKHHDQRDTETLTRKSKPAVSRGLHKTLGHDLFKIAAPFAQTILSAPLDSGLLEMKVHFSFS